MKTLSKEIYLAMLFVAVLSVSSMWITSVFGQTEMTKEAQLISNSNTLSGQANIATNVFVGKVVDIKCVIDDEGRIFTNASISIKTLLKGSTNSQIVTVRYEGGIVGNDAEFVENLWIKGDYALPTMFMLHIDEEIIAFTDPNYNIISYIENPSTSSNSKSMNIVDSEFSTLSQGTQPTTSITESQEYAFNWSTTIRYSWTDLPIYFNIDPDGTPDIPGTPELTAVRTSFSTWENDYFSGIDFYDNGTGLHLTSSNYNAQVGKNIVGWLDLGSSFPIARTYTWAPWGGSYYHIAEVHTVFNDWDGYPWWIGSAQGFIDVENTATHEIGHWLWLGDLYQGANSEQTMYYQENSGEIKKRSLEYGDINGVHYLYPIENDGPTGTDASNTFSGANLVVKGTTYSGRLCYFPSHTDTQDWYKISLHSTDRIMFQMTPASWANFDLELYNPSGTLVAYSRSTGTGVTEYIPMDPMGVAGYWRMRIYAPGSNPITDSGTYTFRISNLPSLLSTIE